MPSIVGETWCSWRAAVGDEEKKEKARRIRKPYEVEESGCDLADV